MRILLVTHRFFPDYLAGTEVYTAELAQGLRRRGHDVHVFTGDPACRSATSFTWSGIPVDVVPWGLGSPPGPISTLLASFFNPAVERRFEQVYAGFRPDVVHIQHLMGLSPRLVPLARSAGARVVVTLHDFWYLCSNAWLYRWDDRICQGSGRGFHCGRCALRRLGRRAGLVLPCLAAPLFQLRSLVLRRALRAADQLIAPSRLVARVYAGLLAPCQQVSILPNPVAELRSPATAAIGDRQGCALRLVYVGAVIRPKGVHVAIDAMTGLDPAAELHICGELSTDPEYVGSLQRLVRHPGILFIGPVDRDQLAATLAGADLLVMPSLWHEAYSLVVDEAFAVGLPVVVSADSAAAERVAHGVNGLVFPAGNSAALHGLLQRLIADQDLLPLLRRGVVKPCGIEEHLDRISSLYLA
jgi:glycosyltransferase involved in cell wall biosynthesis